MGRLTTKKSVEMAFCPLLYNNKERHAGEISNNHNCIILVSVIYHVFFSLSCQIFISAVENLHLFHDLLPSILSSPCFITNGTSKWTNVSNSQSKILWIELMVIKKNMFTSITYIYAFLN